MDNVDTPPEACDKSFLLSTLLENILAWEEIEFYKKHSPSDTE